MPELLIEDVLQGNPLTVSRLLTEVENQTAEGRKLLDALFPHTGKAHLIGITGAPGTGKSTLVNALAHHYRREDQDGSRRTVGVVAVDPSSPFSGGAVLGDRIRMQDLTGDPGVFIRSTASRGSLGGITSTTSGMVEVLDAAGFEIILIETVGAGQAEVEIARLAHTTVVIEAPGLGDDIQTIKAGILEIADLLVVNKADRPDADRAVRALQRMLELPGNSPRKPFHHGRTDWSASPGPESSGDPDRWQVPVLKTIATSGEGIPELAARIADHRNHLRETGGWSRKERSRLKAELDTLLHRSLIARWENSEISGSYTAVLDQLVKRRISPRRAVELLTKGGPHDSQ